MKKGLIFAFSFLTLAFLIIPDFASAQLLPPCTATGNCGLCDIIDTGVKIFRWILGLLGGSALFLFVWHGFGWLTSGGNKEKIDATRKALVHTLIGILLVLLSWFLVNMILVLLLTPAGQTTSVQKLFNNDKAWYEYCTGGSGGNCEGKGEGTPCGSKSSGTFCQLIEGQMKCQNHVEYEDACWYWSKHPGKQYEGYECLPENQCTTGRELGTEYCKIPNTTCCLKK